MTILAEPTTATIHPSTRWLVAAAAMLTHLCLGSVYAWSVFVLPLEQQLSWDKPAVTWAFSTAIASLGLTAAFGAKLMRRLGPRKSVMLSAVLFGLGYAGAATACTINSLPLLYIVFGVIGGMGLGLGYAPPVNALVQWFPDRRGLATGMAVSGFGLGALVASQVAEYALPTMSCASIFWLFAAIYAPIILIAGSVMRRPPEGWSPSGFTPRVAAPSASNSDEPFLKTQRFWLVWAIFFINICAGIMLIALAKPMASKTDLPLWQLALVVPLLGLFNGGGRLAWSAASDRLGRIQTILTMVILQVVLFITMATASSGLLFLAALLIVASCYGGGFALVPALVADIFGPKRAAPAYGAALTAWSAAAICSPPIAAYLHQLTGQYTPTLYGAAGLLVIGGVLTIALSRQTSR